MKFFSLVFLFSILVSIGLSKPSKLINPYRINATSEFGKLGDIEIVDIPVTFFTGDMQTAIVQSSSFLYYTVSLCAVGVQNAEQASLYISVPANPLWLNLDTQPYIMLQISRCENSFVESCIVATNYEWGAHIIAKANITFDMKPDDKEYYIRILAGNVPTLFAMELTFVTGNEPFYYNWTNDLPFSGPNIIGQSPVPLTQYWKSDIAYVVKNRALDYLFSFGYCDEGRQINGINVAVTTAKEKPFSLIEQWACPESVPANDCTQNSAREKGWLNSNVASFNLLMCNKDSQRSTDNGIWLVVLGNGAEADDNNAFYIQASLDVN